MARSPGRYRDHWLPGLVGLTSLLLSLAGWGLLVSERRDQILEASHETAAEVARTLEGQLEEQIETLRGMGGLWSDFGLLPEAEWRAHVGEQIDQVPGLEFVAWVDLDEPRNRVALGGGRSSAALETVLEQARLHHEAPHLEGPERDPSGAASYRVFLPVRTPEEHEGVLVARLRADAFLGEVLRARVRGYALAVLWEGERIYARGTPSQDRWQRWWRIEETIALPLGGTWKLVTRPTPAFAAARLGPLPHYLLAVGVALSLVLAVLAHQLRVTARQSRFLSATNRALEERGQELESKVTERTQELREVIAELEAFNYSVSHDLRSPLGAILNFAAILEEDYRDRPLDAEGLALLERIRRSAVRATALLEGLLQLSRAGREALTLEQIDMTSLAREMFTQVRASEEDADVEFVLEPLPEVEGDRSLLGDVFANLFSNALKYSRDREKRRVSVRGRVSGPECVYEVEDNGRGFDSRFRHKLFGVFERLETREDVEGMGVGLAMVARIVRRHGGRVEADGRLGEGARFAFVLPRRRGP